MGLSKCSTLVCPRSGCFIVNNVNPPCGLIGEKSDEVDNPDTDVARIFELQTKLPLWMVTSVGKPENTPDKNDEEVKKASDLSHMPVVGIITIRRPSCSKLWRGRMRLGVPLDHLDLIRTFTILERWVASISPYITDRKWKRAFVQRFPKANSQLTVSSIGEYRYWTGCQNEGGTAWFSYSLLRQFSD